MNTTDYNSLMTSINQLKAETADGAITPTRLGTILANFLPAVITSASITNGVITLYSNGVAIVSVSIPDASADNAGLLSSVDYGTLMLGIESIDTTTTTSKVDLVLTDHDGAESAVTIGAASTSAAGVMTASDKTALNGAIKSANISSDKSKVTISMTPVSGTASSQTIEAATTLKAGVMTADDRIYHNLKTSGYAITFSKQRADDASITMPVFSGQKILIYVESTDMSSSEILQYDEKFVMTINDVEVKANLVSSGNYTEINIPQNSINGFKLRKNTTRFGFNVKLFVI